MGKNKLVEPVGGRPLLQRVIDTLDPIIDRILIVTGQGQPYPSVKAGRSGLVIVSDIYPKTGPLGGICTGLSHSDSDSCLVVAADMPFLNPGLLRHLMDAATGFDAVVPRIDGLIQPLHAVYSRACLPIIHEEIGSGRFQIRVILERVRVKYVEGPEIDAFDVGQLSFFNVNTPDELAEARRIAGAG